jgi:hypothetical protein
MQVQHIIKHNIFVIQTSREEWTLDKCILLLVVNVSFQPTQKSSWVSIRTQMFENTLIDIASPPTQ